ncbi:hypothetical protein PU99_02865 [Pseudomonas putida]|nr:FAD-dependent oxidoreductase [Pseudomonas putida]KKX68449.1 hypothetical protein PU99_02865 [Pseudomonas putida]
MTHRIVIVGGGAGGLELATRLGNRLGRRNKAHITLVDANLTHIWKPLFHEVAAGSLNPGMDELNYVAQARWNHFHFQYGRMIGIDRTEKTIRLAHSADGQGGDISAERLLHYDTLVIAVGSQSNDFGTKGVQQYCSFLDSRLQAEKLHQTLLSRYLSVRIWAAGIKAPQFLASLGGVATNRLNQLEVKTTLQTTTDESIFALGDCAACPVQGDEGRNVPPRAQAAHQQAKFLARNLELRIEGRPLKSFTYKDYGTLVSLASFSAVGTLMGNLAGSTFVEGMLARLFYLSLYRMHQASLFGVGGMFLKVIGDALSRRVRPKLRLH